MGQQSHQFFFFLMFYLIFYFSPSIYWLNTVMCSHIQLIVHVECEIDTFLDVKGQEISLKLHS